MILKVLDAEERNSTRASGDFKGDRFKRLIIYYCNEVKKNNAEKS